MIDRLIRSRRRTLSLQVNEDATLTVRAPERLSEAVILGFVREKEAWILKKKKQARESWRPPVQRDPKEEAWCRHGAFETIAPRVEYFARLTGLRPTKIKITGARTRWGSCSPSGTVSFSWHLALSPPDVIDYVVVHELVHLDEKNHSRRFWNKVGRILPDYRRQLQWLRRNGHELMR